jgi:MoaA/NifB/PqqE/SkfB family radical SAM enzyme
VVVQLEGFIMLTGIHILLTYACTYECDHCFLYCSPFAEGTFTIEKIRQLYDQASQLDSIKEIYLEGGEPFLYYALMLESARLAREKGYDVGIVTNAYWAVSSEDAELWLKPFVDIGLYDLSISDDELHGSEAKDSPAKLAYNAAMKLGLPTASICIEKPTVMLSKRDPSQKGKAVIGGDVLFKGRAADKLTSGLPRQDYASFRECPHEDLISPSRVHVDPFGNVMVCQGLSIGNIFNTPLAQIISEYNPEKHPICGPLLKGGPAQLAREYYIQVEPGYVDACHLCFLTRRALIDKFPQYLTPPQVYDVENK